MPIEIRELLIKATISEACDKKKERGETCPDEREIMIAEVVERILQIFKEKEER